MIEYVFRPSRRVKGKRVVSRLYSGAYSLGKGEKSRRVALHTPDKTTALAMLRKIIVERQREREGILAPASVREAAAMSLVDLVNQYEADLSGRDLTGPHVKETVARIRRIIGDLKWTRLGDVRADSFVAWRARLDCSAKTKKEYQTSANAFFNWLVRLGRVLVNPLERIDRVQTRGKAVRQSRAYTEAEFSALLAVAPWHRRIVYLFLGYTGLRKAEARGLLWSAVDFSAGIVRVKGKGGRERSVPLRVELVQALWEFSEACHDNDFRLPKNWSEAEKARVFPVWPSDDALHADLRRAKIERKDAAGRVVHWHAFRKTFNTWAAGAGVGLRSAQAMLGHSTPVLTANVYTDAEALPLRREVAKLPWLGGGRDVAEDAQKCARIATATRFRGLLSELISLAENVVLEGKTEFSALPKLAARHGFEP